MAFMIVQVNKLFNWLLRSVFLTCVKCGNCFKYESLFHIACVIIWDNSMAAMAGDSQPFDDNTSTQACVRRTAFPENKEIFLLEIVLSEMLI